MPKILENVKDDICATTRRMLSEDGYEKLNIRAIAKKCSIGTGTIYNYFKSKDEIIFDIVMSDWTRTLHQMDFALNGEFGVWEKLEAIFGLLCEFINGFHGMFIDMSSSPEFQRNQKIEPDEVRRQRTSYKSHLEERVRAAIDGHAVGLTPEEKDFVIDSLTHLFLSKARSGEFDFRSAKRVFSIMEQM